MAAVDADGEGATDVEGVVDGVEAEEEEEDCDDADEVEAALARRPNTASENGDIEMREVQRGWICHLVRFVRFLIYTLFVSDRG